MQVFIICKKGLKSHLILTLQHCKQRRLLKRKLNSNKIISQKIIMNENKSIELCQAISMTPLQSVLS